MSKRPLLPGAFHFVLSQAVASDRFDRMLGKIANGFNLLHGRVYNHVITQGNKLIYAIDNKDFPSPFELTARQLHSFLECIAILMHTLFGICANTNIDSYLCKVTTKRRLSSFPKHTGNRLNQLAYWDVPTAYGSKNYALIYDYSIASLPVKLRAADLPEPSAIFGEVATLIECNHRVSPANVPIADRVIDLILKQTVSANEPGITAQSQFQDVSAPSGRIEHIVSTGQAKSLERTRKCVYCRKITSLAKSLKNSTIRTREAFGAHSSAGTRSRLRSFAPNEIMMCPS